MWDENYPTKELIAKEIDTGKLFTILKSKKLIVSFVLDDYLDDCWKPMGWSEDNFLGLHLVAVHPAYQRQGYGKKVLKFSENFAKVNNYKCIRLDVLSKNDSALNLYKKNGYKKVGELNFDFKPEGFQIYYCYEKLL